MSGGPQRIPKGFAQKVGAAEPKPGFTLGQGVAGASRRMARRRQKRKRRQWKKGKACKKC